MKAYNPYFKLDDPHVSPGGVFWYGFRCEECGKQDTGHYSQNDTLPKGMSTLCHDCFVKSGDIQL